MTGWFLAFGLAALTFLAMLLLGRIPRSAREISAAALLLGLAGYAWQGNPGLAGAPRSTKPVEGQFDEKLAEERRNLGERFGPTGQWLILSDGLGRQDFAFRRAMALDAEGLAPRYFYGLALARNNQLQAARAIWAPLAESAPEDSRMKTELQANIARIDALLAQDGTAAP